MIRYRTVQNKNSKSSSYGKWYARAVMTDTTNLDTLAERIQRNCSVKKSDVLAVLTEMKEVMQDELQSSHRVKLDGFGSFKIGLITTSAASAEKFSTDNIVGMRVIFQPDLKISADGTRTRAFITGAKVGAMPASSGSDGGDA